jgi:hypothetical protein
MVEANPPTISQEGIEGNKGYDLPIEPQDSEKVERLQ